MMPALLATYLTRLCSGFRTFSKQSNPLRFLIILHTKTYLFIYFTANQPITIQRKVVLMTDDRNLRVKAYTRNVPVLTIPQFRKMARL